MTPLSNRHRLENTFMVLKSFIYVNSGIIDDVILKNSSIYTIYGIFERKFAWDHEYMCSAVFYWLNTCIYNSNFWSNGAIPTLRGRKISKSKVKMWSKLSKISKSFRSAQEAWNNSIGQFRGENEIHELFSPFWPPLFPLNRHRDFYCQV